MRNFLIVVVILAGITSCKKDTAATAPTSLLDSLYGKWSYAGRSGGFAGGTETATTKDKIVAEFAAPGNFKFTDNNIVRTQGTFVIKKDKSFLLVK